MPAPASSLLPDLLASRAGLDRDVLRALAQDLALWDVDDWVWALRTQRVRDACRGGEELQRILAPLVRTLPRGSGPVPLTVARRHTARLLSRLQNIPPALRLLPAGGVRRMEPWVESIEVLATAHDPHAFLEAATQIPFLSFAKEVHALPDQRALRAEATFEDDTPLVLEVHPDGARAAWRVVELTGPLAHVQALRAHALALGLRIQDGCLQGGRGPLPLQEEREVYAALGLDFIPAELRGENLHASLDPLVGPEALRGAAILRSRCATGAHPLSTWIRRLVSDGYRWALAADRAPGFSGPTITVADFERLFAEASQGMPSAEETASPGCEISVGLEVLATPEGVRVPEGYEAARVLVAALDDGPAARSAPSPAHVARALERAALDERVGALLHPDRRVAGQRQTDLNRKGANQ